MIQVGWQPGKCPFSAQLGISMGVLVQLNSNTYIYICVYINKYTHVYTYVNRFIYKIQVYAYIYIYINICGTNRNIFRMILVGTGTLIELGYS